MKNQTLEMRIKDAAAHAEALSALCRRFDLDKEKAFNLYREYYLTSYEDFSTNKGQERIINYIWRGKPTDMLRWKVEPEV